MSMHNKFKIETDNLNYSYKENNLESYMRGVRSRVFFLNNLEVLIYVLGIFNLFIID